LRKIGKSEPLFKHDESAHIKNEADELVEHEKSKLVEKVFGVIYVLFIIGITLAVLMELKMEYQIDIFPGINSPFDDVYRDAKNVLSGDSPPPSQ
jgi:hypothetical protein